MGVEVKDLRRMLMFSRFNAFVFKPFFARSPFKIYAFM